MVEPALIDGCLFACSPVTVRWSATARSLLSGCGNPA